MVNAMIAAGAVGAGLFSVIVGLLLSPIPTNVGLYRWMASRNPQLVGMSPAFHHGIEWGYTFEDLYSRDLSGQKALVTGANSGIGFEASLALARLGASVTLACRSPRKCDEAAERIRSDNAFRGDITTMTLDTSSLNSVKAFVKHFLVANEVLDMLFLNAGTGSAGLGDDGTFPLSEDGVEMVFATNVLGHHLLYKLLQPIVLRSKLGRVVLTSSASSFDSFEWGVATDIETLNGVNATVMASGKIYGQSKLAQVLLAKEMARRLGTDSNVYVNAFHPGVVNTAIFEKNPLIPAPMMSLINYARESIMWNSTEGALTMLFLGVATNHLVEKGIRGKYFHPQAQEVVNPLALDEDLQRKLWMFCDDLVKDHM